MEVFTRILILRSWLIPTNRPAFMDIAFRRSSHCSPNTCTDVFAEVSVCGQSGFREKPSHDISNILGSSLALIVR